MARARLSTLLENLTGNAGTVQVQRTQRGFVVRSRPSPKDPQTPAQLKIRKLMAKAAAAWQDLTEEQVKAWRAYAENSPATGFNAFCGLTVKLLQISPNAPIPALPPANPLLPDALVLSATGGAGKVDFNRVSGQNTTGILTELLLQKLPSRHRLPLPKSYKTQTFRRYTSFSTKVTVTAEPGYYAAAYRFVNQSTGQETQLIPLPKIQVQ